MTPLPQATRAMNRVQDCSIAVTAETPDADLQEENRLLFNQLHVVQEELERLHEGGAGPGGQALAGRLTIDWVDDGLPELMAENLRYRSLLETQQEVHRIEAQHTLAGKLGEILIAGTTSTAALLAVPGKLHKVWQAAKEQTPPDELGGKGFEKVLAAYRQGGLDAVDALLSSLPLSAGMQANAFTALARSLMHQEPVRSAELARRAYASEPRPFRLKWLAFRLHEAGESLEAAALLEVLPANLHFSDSELRHAERLRREAARVRLQQAKEKCAFSERRAEVERQISSLSQARDEQAALAAQRLGEIEELTQEHAALRARSLELQSKVAAVSEARDEQATLALLRLREIAQLQRAHSRLEDEHSVLQTGMAALGQAHDEQSALAAQRLGEIAGLQQALSRIELEQSVLLTGRRALQAEVLALSAARDEQSALAAERQSRLDTLQFTRDRLEDERSVFSARCQMLQDDVAALKQARDERGALAEQRKSEIEALQQARDELEHEQSALRARCQALQDDVAVLTQARDERGALAEQRKSEIEALQQARDELEHEQSALRAHCQALQDDVAVLTQARDERGALAEQRKSEIEALQQARDELEHEQSALLGRSQMLQEELARLTQARDEQSALAAQRQDDLAITQAALRQLEEAQSAWSERHQALQEEVAALVRARDERSTLAAQRQGEIDTLQHARSRQEQEMSALLTRSHALQAEVAALARVRDEQTILAAQRQGEVLQLTRTQASLESENAALGLKLRELEQHLEQLMRARDEQTRLVAQQIQELAAALAANSGAVDEQFRKQADELIRLRKYLDGAFRNEIANSSKQTQALIGLQSYYATGELPTVNSERHSWPVSPDFGLYLVELVALNDYDLIIEFGSGISTVIVAKALATMAAREDGRAPTHFISFEHLEPYYRQTRAHLQQAGLVENVQLVLAPLQDWQAPNGNTYAFYDCQAVLVNLAQRYAGTVRRVLAIIDGPPAATGKHARYPAGPLLVQHCVGARIDLVLDDYIREDEKEIAQLWQGELQAAGIAHRMSERKLEKDACLISVYPAANGAGE